VCLIFIPRHLIGQQCVATLTHNFFKLLFLASLKCVKLHLSCLKKGYQKLSKDKKIRSPPGATTEISKMSSHIFPPKRRKNKSRQAEKRVYTTLTCHLS
jgi:DNA-binding transcriptional regulator YhcF (GntR family)